MKISKLSDYALQVISVLAASSEPTMSAQALADQSHLSLPTVQKVLKLLAMASLLESVRGAQGGYALLLSPRKISLTRILAAIDGETPMIECHTGNSVCCHYATCTVRGVWDRISNGVTAVLDAVTLHDIMTPSRLHDWESCVTTSLQQFRKDIEQ